LGSCVGSGLAKSTFLARKITKICELLDSLNDMEDPQVALLLLRSCFGHPKICYALRTLEYEDVKKSIKGFDKAISETLSHIFGAELSDTQQYQRV
jgi:hypothetical protein